MIQVNRTPVPPILKTNSGIWKNAYLKARKKFENDGTVSSQKKLMSAERKYNHAQVKDALRSMFSDKCAYCESHITHVGFAHIEHFRPKSKFPHLCFDWDNLLLGCSVCNGAQYKGTNFPDETEKGPILNPVDENPDNYLSFDYDPETGTANVLGKSPRGITTIDIAGLNRTHLVRHRSDVVRMIAFVAIRAKKGDQQAIVELNRCCEKDQEYSAFARSFKNKFGIGA
jgi:uncharacterized protein (TIGR02646 family)